MGRTVPSWLLMPDVSFVGPRSAWPYAGHGNPRVHDGGSYRFVRVDQQPGWIRVGLLLRRSDDLACPRQLRCCAYHHFDSPYRCAAVVRVPVAGFACARRRYSHGFQHGHPLHSFDGSRGLRDPRCPILARRLVSSRWLMATFVRMASCVHPVVRGNVSEGRQALGRHGRPLLWRQRRSTYLAAGLSHDARFGCRIGCRFRRSCGNSGTSLAIASAHRRVFGRGERRRHRRSLAIASMLRRISPFGTFANVELAKSSPPRTDAFRRPPAGSHMSGRA